MDLPEDTCLWLTVWTCRGVPKLLGDADNAEGRAMRQRAKDAYVKAQFKMKEVCEELLKPVNCRPIETLHTTLSRRSAKLEAAREQYMHGRDERAPNPYVVVTLDEREHDATGMLHTKACRSTRDPLFDHKFQPFPLGMYSVGRKAMAIYERRDMNYTPQRLVFLVFHDDGVPVDGVPSSIREERWERASATQRSELLARAEWDIEDLVKIINCPNEVTKNLPLYNARTGNRIQDSELTIRVRVTSGKRYVLRCCSWFRRIFCGCRRNVAVIANPPERVSCASRCAD